MKTVWKELKYNRKKYLLAEIILALHGYQAEQMAIIMVECLLIVQQS